MWRKCKDQVPDDEKERLVIITYCGEKVIDIARHDDGDWCALSGTVKPVAWWDADLPSIPDKYY